MWPSEAKQMEAEARRARLAESQRSEATEEAGQPPEYSSVDGGDVIPEASSDNVSPPPQGAGQASSFDGAGGAVTAGDAGRLLNLVA